MKLKRGGAIFDVSHPSEIARMKRAGFVEVKDEEIQADAQAAADKTIGTGSKPAESPVEPPVEPSTDENKPKGKGKK